MSTGYQTLTEKEKQTLRLIVRGHDAKSSARHLGLSVHTVNERLRDARRKLEVSSSREAARLVLETESADPQNLADKTIGEAAAPESVAMTVGQRRTRAAVVIIGAAVMLIFIGLVALSFVATGNAPPATLAEPSATVAPAPAAAGESEAVRSARDWLLLHDQRRWKDTWLGTTTSFRSSNTLESWAQIAEQARAPLGAVLSRTVLSQESVPAPPAGVVVVKFRTSFANKADAVETVSLAREGSDWKVVGIYID